jgi:hypothetical protein
MISNTHILNASIDINQKLDILEGKRRLLVITNEPPFLMARRPVYLT